MKQFAPGFLIGASTAAHQVEGNNLNSDCWALENIPHTLYVDRSGDAVDHYHLYEQDIRLMAEAAEILNGGQRAGRNDVKRHGVSPPRLCGCAQIHLHRWAQTGCGRPPHRAGVRPAQRASAAFDR